MNHIMKFNESNQELDLSFAISKIKTEFSKKRVIDMFNDEWPNWVDEEDSEDLNSYLKNSNGEAEEIVYSQIIDWYKNMFNRDLSEENENHLIDYLKEIYNFEN